MTESESTLDSTVPFEEKIPMIRPKQRPNPNEIVHLRENERDIQEPDDFGGRVLQLLQLVRLVVFNLLLPSWVLALSRFLLSLVTIVTLIFVSSHDDYLSSACLSFALLNMVAMSVLYAIVQTCMQRTTKDDNSTTCAMLQRMFFLWFLYCLLMLAFLMNCSSLIGFLASDETANSVERFCFIITPGLFFLGVSYILQSYMLFVKDSSIYCVLVCNTSTLVINIVLNSILPRDGIGTGAMAADLSYLCLSVLLFLWIVWDDDYRCSWTGFSFEALCKWSDVFRSLAKATCVNLTLCFFFHLLTFLLGAKHKEWLIVHALNVFLMEAIFLFMQQFAILVSKQIKDSTMEGYLRRTLFLIKSSLMLLWAIGLVVGVMIAVLTRNYTQMFLFYREIKISVELPVAGTFPFLCAVQLLGFYVTESNRPNERKNYIALVVCQTLSLIIAISLLYTSKTGVYGVWLAYLTGYVLQMFYFLSLLYGYVEELSPNYPRSSVKLFTQRDIEGETGGYEGLLLRLPNLRERHESVEILCTHSVGSIDALARPVVSEEGWRALPRHTLLWRGFNLIVCLLVLSIGFVKRYA